MKLLIVGLAALACATSAEAAEVWTRSYNYSLIGSETGGQSTPMFLRFELSPPDLIQTAPPFLGSHAQDHYRILQNSAYGIVATFSFSEIEAGQKNPTIGAYTVVIDKGSGEFWWSMAIIGQPAIVNQPVHGKCLKD